MSERPGVVVDVAELDRFVRGVAADIGRERRERIATAVLAGIVASERSSADGPRQMAADAKVLADALIEELDK